MVSCASRKCEAFRRGFLLGRQSCRPIWCSVWRMVWALTGWPPTPSTSALMLAALIRLFPKHNLWIWRWARALNFFGRPWRGLFWVEPVLSDPHRVLCHEVPCWTSSDQYERVRAITTNLTYLLPIHTWDLVTLTSQMRMGRENG